MTEVQESGLALQPHAMASSLKDAAVRWLQPKTDDSHNVMDTVVMEQLLQLGLAPARHWVTCLKPDTLKATFEL